MKFLGGHQVSCSVTISLETGAITDAGARPLPFVLEFYWKCADSFPMGSRQQFPAIMYEAPCSSPALQKIALVFSHPWNPLAPWRRLCPSPIPLGGHMETQTYSGSCHRFPGLLDFGWFPMKILFIYLLVPASQSCLVGMRRASKFVSADASALAPKMPFLPPFPGPLAPTLPFSLLHNLWVISLKPACIFVDNTFIMIISVSPVLFRIWNHVLHLVGRNPTDKHFRGRPTHICISVSAMFFEEMPQDLGRVFNSGISGQPIEESF